MLDSRYVLEKRLGAGAMGVVYLGRRQKLGRAFAIKVLHEHLTTEPALVRRFEQEAEIAGTLCHRNLVQIIDFGRTEEGTRYTVMELVIGKNLTASLGSPMPPDRVICLARQMLDGLQHAHEAGLVHRDFKPDNVIVETDSDGRETPRILDFGIAILRTHACSYESSGRLTTMGRVLGTPAYMAPEQARGLPIDHRADLFALGVTCYQMLTGRIPFDGSGLEIAVANMSEEPPPMSCRAPGPFDPLLEAFTRKLLAKRADGRPQSAREARALLDLIERDRAAAAEALGLTPEPQPDVTTPLPVIASAEATPAPQARAPRRARRVLPRGATVGAFAVLVAISAASWAMTTTSSSTPAETITIAPQDLGAAALASGPERIVARAQLAPPPRSSRHTRATPSDRARARKSTPTAAPESPRPEVAAVAPPTPAMPPVPRPITASSVAALYITVGQELAELSRARPEAARDLWMRYRLLRINEAVAHPAGRAEGEVVLSTIKNEIARRTANPPAR